MKGLSGTLCDLFSVLLPCFSTLFCYVSFWLLYWASLVAQMVKNLPVVQETGVPPLGREDPLEKGTATHSSILAWRIP